MQHFYLILNYKEYILTNYLTHVGWLLVDDGIGEVGIGYILIPSRFTIETERGDKARDGLETKEIKSA